MPVLVASWGPMRKFPSLLCSSTLLFPRGTVARSLHFAQLDVPLARTNQDLLGVFLGCQIEQFSAQVSLP